MSANSPATPSAQDPDVAAAPFMPARTGSIAISLLRITLGVIILATWWDNLQDELYTGDGLSGLIDWLFTPSAEGGNGSTLSLYERLLDTVVVPNAGVFAIGQLIIEGLFGLGLLVGASTRAASIGAMVFFSSLFLAYYGGDEWIWTYVLLFVASLTVFLGWGGRTLGVDRFVANARGESPRSLFW